MAGSSRWAAAPNPRCSEQGDADGPAPGCVGRSAASRRSSTTGAVGASRWGQPPGAPVTVIRVGPGSTASERGRRAVRRAARSRGVRRSADVDGLDEHAVGTGQQHRREGAELGDHRDVVGGQGAPAGDQRDRLERASTGGHRCGKGSPYGGGGQPRVGVLDGAGGVGAAVGVAHGRALGRRRCRGRRPAAARPGRG